MPVLAGLPIRAQFSSLAAARIFGLKAKFRRRLYHLLWDGIHLNQGYSRLKLLVRKRGSTFEHVLLPRNVGLLSDGGVCACEKRLGHQKLSPMVKLR